MARMSCTARWRIGGICWKILVGKSNYNSDTDSECEEREAREWVQEEEEEYWGHVLHQRRRGRLFTAWRYACESERGAIVTCLSKIFLQIQFMPAMHGSRPLDKISCRTLQNCENALCIIQKQQTWTNFLPTELKQKKAGIKSSTTPAGATQGKGVGFSNGIHTSDRPEQAKQTIYRLLRKPIGLCLAHLGPPFPQWVSGACWASTPGLAVAPAARATTVVIIPQGNLLSLKLIPRDVQLEHWRRMRLLVRYWCIPLPWAVYA